MWTLKKTTPTVIKESETKKYFQIVEEHEYDTSSITFKHR